MLSIHSNQCESCLPYRNSISERQRQGTETDRQTLRHRQTQIQTDTKLRDIDTELNGFKPKRATDRN